MPLGYDIMTSFVFEDEEAELPYRALLFVNGWFMGKRVANLGYVFQSLTESSRVMTLAQSSSQVYRA